MVVTVVDGGEQLRRCLAALSRQSGGPELDVVVPYDDTCDLGGLEREFPSFRFLRLGAVRTTRPSDSPAGQHELFDRRRAVGLAAVTGDLVAIIEDRGLPRPDWARLHADLHARLPHEVIGGAIDWAGNGILSWAIYACDFSRYASTTQPGPRAFVSDCNVTYKRAAIERTSPLWRERYHETEVHDALRANGGILWFAREPVVEEARSGLHVSSLLAERFAWARLYGATRVAGVSPVSRIARCLACVALPPVLYWRIVRRYVGLKPLELIRATPALLLLLSAWALGEFVGYATTEP